MRTGQLALPIQLAGLGTARLVNHPQRLPATWKRLSTCSAYPVRLVGNHLKKLSGVSILYDSS